MISTRRIVAAVGLAAGITALAAPLACASDATIQNKDASQLNPISTLDALAQSGIPAERRSEVPRPSEQLQQLNRLNNLAQMGRVARMGTPGGLPGF
ncbi:hypothetical protein P2Q00_45095 [Streptomyces coacervatus]|nr:hypothetical protein [Streptomyces coacervatus]MDF2272522.1 hypothetical protein [Streptomyces coacervatus]